MQLLQNKGLYGKGLFEITSQEMVNRYNMALEFMGLPTTALAQFSIDMLGWSPEIAAEQDNTYYLTQSLANPVAVIVNINQRHASIYFPYHSFDRPMISRFLDEFANQIMEINTREPLCIDLDNGVSVYSDINDLLLVQSFAMKVDTPNGLISGAIEQQQLVTSFLESDHLWEDKNARSALIKSGEKFGDLRNKNLLIPPLEYTHLKIFYSEAFGGVYILNNPPGVTTKETIIIFNDSDTMQNHSCSHKHIRFEALDDEYLINKLIGAKYLQLDLSLYKKNHDLLEQKKDIILAIHICQNETNYCSWSSLKKKNFIAKHSSTIPALFFELERVQQQLQTDINIDLSTLSPPLIKHLVTPHGRIGKQYHFALERLLSSLIAEDPIRLFTYNKNVFYSQYLSFSECKKNWIAEHLNRNN